MLHLDGDQLNETLKKSKSHCDDIADGDSCFVDYDACVIFATDNNLLVYKDFDSYCRADLHNIG